MKVKTTLAFVLAIAITGHTAALSAAEDDNVRLMVGRSAVVNTDSPIARVSLTSADIADALVTTPNQLLIQGKVPGTISMFVWDRGGAMRRYNVTVERDVTELAQQVKQLFPGEPINVEGNGKSVVLAGIVTSKYVAEKAVEVAAGFVDKKEDVVSLLQVREGAPPQVLLRVRFAEVSRSALTELGSSFFTGANGYKDWVGRTSTQQFPAPTFDDGKLVFSDFLNLFLFNTEHNVGTVIRALQARGLFQSLAEPNLVAETGKEASFLAGGEFPIPVAQAGGTGVAITVVFKEFGVRLNFTPNVVGGDRIRLKVRPEVSTLDFSNAITLEGFRIPALSTRRTETELELRNGQTFAVAGLLNNNVTQSLQKIPGIGDIPILGLLFRSKAAQKNQTELVVMITPEIVQQNSPGVTNELPRLQEPYLGPIPPNRARPYPAPGYTVPGWGVPEPGVPQRPTTPPPSASNNGAQPTTAAPTPAEAAAVMRNQFPKAPTMISEAELSKTPAATPVDHAAPPARPAAAPAAAVRPLTKDEEKRLEKIREQERKAEAVRAGEAYRAAQEQAKRDQEKAREQAKRDAVAAEKAAKEAARKAEADKKRQKEIDEAAKRLKDAEAAYQAELTKKTKQQ